MTEQQSPRPAPYPAATLSKGWRFELNMEQVKKSETWLRARTGMVRALLLLLWAEAWEQTPCGSLPNDDELLGLLLGLEPEEFAKHKPVLLRGWWLADDGRLYHDTITERVQDMLKARAANAKRVAGHKAKKRDSGSGNALPPDRTTITDPGSYDTRTRTRTSIETEDFNSSPGASDLADDSAFGDEPPPPDAPPPEAEDGAGLPEAKGTPYGLIAKAIKEAGVMPNAGHPTFRLLVDAGADVLEFLAFSEKAKTMRDPFAYMLGCVEGERKRAKATAGQLHRGAMPAPTASPKAQAKAAEVQAWFGSAFDPLLQPNETAHGATPLLG